MKKTVKRILSALLVAVILIGIAPINSLVGLNVDGAFGLKVSAADKNVRGGQSVYITSNSGNWFQKLLNIVPKTEVEFEINNNQKYLVRAGDRDSVIAISVYEYKNKSWVKIGTYPAQARNVGTDYSNLLTFKYEFVYDLDAQNEEMREFVDNVRLFRSGWAHLTNTKLKLEKTGTKYRIDIVPIINKDMGIAEMLTGGSYNGNITDIGFTVKAKYGTITSVSTITTAQSYNSGALLNQNAVVTPAQTVSVQFTDLIHSINQNKRSVSRKAAASSDVTADDRIVKATLSGNIKNSNGIGLKYGVYLKAQSNQITGNDIVWNNNNTTYNKSISVSCTESNLIPNTKYYYAVYAKTNNCLYCSEIKSFVTPKVRPYETKIKSVKTVNYRNGELLNTNELGVGDSVTVEWDGSLPKYAEWYKMEIIHPDGTTEIKDQIKGTKATVRLTEVGDYSFRVRACNTAGESDWTNTEDKATVYPDVSLIFKAGNDEIGYRTYEAHTLTWNHDLESMPAIPARAGAVFCGWFHMGEETLASVKNIRKDTELYAGYKDSVFTVRFQDANGKDIGDPQKVTYGGTAEPPAANKVPVSNGYKFIGWDHSCANIVENLTIRAVINKQDGELPVTIVNDGSSAGMVTAERHPYGYVVNCTVRNETLNDARGRVIVAVKSEQGKLLTITESEAYYIEGNDRGVLTDDPNADKSNYNSEQIKIVIPIDPECDANGLNASTAEVYAVESFRKTVPVSNAVITSIVDCDPWSKWTTENRDGYSEGDKQERTEYRYQVLQTTQTNFLTEKNALVEQGWSYNGTNADDPIIVTSGWSKTKPQDLEYRAIEEKTVDDYTPMTYYLYKRYRYYNNGWWYSYGSSWATSYGYSGTWQYKKTTSPLSCFGYVDGIAKYGNENDFWYAGGSNTGQGKTNEGIDYTKNTASIPVKTGSHKEYRSVDTIYTYNLNKWSDWSEWSSETPILEIPADKIVEKETEIPLDSFEREGKEGVVQTRKFYRYKDNQIIVTPTVDPNPPVIDETFCTGDLGVEYAGKQLTMFVFKYNEVSDWTTEYVAQSTVDNDGSYTFEQGVLREKPTVDTGDFTVILSVQGSTDSIYLGSIKAPTPKYTVIYKDSAQFGGETISTQTVEKGVDAEVPSAPEHEGYTFSHWDTRSTDIQSDLVINAVYTRNEYVVIFYDAQKKDIDKPISYMLIPHGATLRVSRKIGAAESNEAVFYCPYVAESAEVEFVKWDSIDPVRVVDPETNEEVIVSEEITVTSDMVLTAMYAPRSYEVVFMDISEQKVEQTTQGLRAAVRGTTEIGEKRAVKVQEVQYGETLTMTNGFIDDIDFGEDVILFGWAEEGNDALVDMDTYAITEDTYLIPQFTFINTVETPVANVESGSYTSTQTVTLTTETENALIYYTLDGTDPASSETAIEYTQPISISTSCILRTMACKFNCNNSDESKYVYAVNDGSNPAQHVVTYMVYDCELPLTQFLVNEGDTIDPSILLEAEGYTFDNAYRSVQNPSEDEEYPLFSNPWNFANETVTEDIVLYINYTANNYTVTFLDYDGFVLDEQEIAYGSSAEEPNAPQREGYVFVGWDTEAYECVTGDLDVNAVYVPESEYVRITLNQTNYTITASTSFHLTAVVTGNMENHELVWSSSDENVAVVDNDGNVLAIGKGIAEITVQVTDSIECAVCKLTVLPNPNVELMLRSNSYLSVDACGFIRGFAVRTDSEMLYHTAPTVAEIKNEFVNSNLIFINLNGKTLTDDDFIGTGTVIRLMEGEKELDSLTVVVAGDLDRDGYVSNRDAAWLTRYLVDKETADDAQITAMDVNGDGYINNRDASVISRYLVGKEVI